MTDHKLPLLYVFDRKPEIEREEGFLLAGLLAIDPIITGGNIIGPGLKR
jgi:hypothetical protein